MSDDAPDIAVAPAPRVLERVRRGVRQPHNWVQLVRFGVVGASGYVVNLAVFALFIDLVKTGHRTAAVAAFLVAVANNFLLNRRWTFESTGHRGRQGAQFLTVSLAGFVVALAILEVLVRAGLPALGAQAISIAAATPMNFIGNKLWTFRER